MRLVIFLLALIAFGALAWYGLRFGPGGNPWPVQTPPPLAASPPATDPAAAAASFGPPTLLIEPSERPGPDDVLSPDSAVLVPVAGTSLAASIGGKPEIWRTVRVWGVEEAGQDRSIGLLNILRPPFGDGKVGGFTAFAVSPDKTLVAAAAIRVDDATPVYVFDRVNGRIVTTLNGLAATITTLTFSPDGQKLAIGLSAGGLRVYRISDWRFVAQDAFYGDKITGMAFDAAGRLVTASLDGHVRLYDPAISTVRKQKAPLSNQPYGVAFSPDGSQIAIGYLDKAGVSLVDGARLERLRDLAPPRDGMPFEGLNEVAWSKNGRAVFATGTYTNASGRFALVQWSAADPDQPPTEVAEAASPAMINRLAPYDVDGVLTLVQVAANDDPNRFESLALTAFDGSGAVKARLDGRAPQSRTPEMAADSAAFRISYDGKILEVPIGTEVLRVDLAKRLADTVAANALDLAPPRQTHPDMRLSDWRNATQPLFTDLREGDSKRLILDDSERALSFAIAPSDQYFLLGTNLAIRKYTFRGSLRQTIAAPGAVRRVTLSGDGRVIVAAFSDGTIRWYNAVLGSELLALYVSPRDRRWIVWTPTGFYDASAGADDLIVWQISRRGGKAPLTYSAKVFADIFYRPDLATQVLRDLAVPAAPAPQSLWARLPPVVTILTSQQKPPSQLEVVFEVESPSGRAVTQLAATIDGVRTPVDLSDGPLPLERPLSLTFDLPAGSEGRQVALTAGQVEGAAAAEGTPPPARFGDSSRGFVLSGRDTQGTAFRKLPRLRSLLVGVSDYRDAGVRDLAYAQRDAEMLRDALLRQMSRFYETVEPPRLLTGPAATREAIVEALEDLLNTGSPDDVTLIFFAGHGVPDPRDVQRAGSKRYYFISWDADYSNNRLASTAVPYSQLLTYIKEMKGRRLVFLDTCYAGLIAAPDMNGIANEAGSFGVYVAAATSGDSLALENDAWRNGALTSALLKALNGQAGADMELSPNGHITTEGLRLWLRKEIRRLTGDQQNPAILDTNTDAVEIAAVVPAG
jgi:WD40 repeat protein